MNTTKKKILAVVLMAVILLGGTGIIMYQQLLSKTNSPEYTLVKVIMDVKSQGISGLKEHLTEEAWSKIEPVAELSENSVVSGILSTVKKDQDVNVLIDKISEIDWTIEDILKGKKGASVVMGFNYDDTVVGTIDLNMEKINGEWKISGVGIPSFEKFFDEKGEK